jgi:hypothetical protein
MLGPHDPESAAAIARLRFLGGSGVWFSLKGFTVEWWIFDQLSVFP